MVRFVRMWRGECCPVLGPSPALQRVVAYCSVATSVWWSRQTESSPTEGVVMVTCLLVLLDVHCPLFSFTWLTARAKSGCGTNQ